jgi:hypothetical protein
MPMNSPKRNWRNFARLPVNPDFWAPLLLVFLGVLFFSDFLFSSKNFYFRDILNFHYPLRKLLIDSYAHREFPLWNPYMYLGQPMLANPNYMAFYPTNLLHLFLPFNYAFKLHFILHPILGGLGIYSLQRVLGLKVVPALGGSLVYQFSGTVLSFLNVYNIIPAVALLPWIACAFVWALRSNWFPRSLLFGALLALQIIALEPLIFFCNAILLIGLSLLYVLEGKERHKAFKNLLRVGLVGFVFALGLAAVQILPTMELLPRSERSAGVSLSIATSWSIHPIEFLNTIIPNFFGTPYTIGQQLFWGEPFHHGREGYLVSFFLGTGTLLLTALSFTSSRKKLIFLLTILAAVSIFLALGRYNPVYNWMVEHIPLFRLGRYPSKYFLLSTLVFSIMAALGMEALLDMRARHLLSERRRTIAIVVCASLAGMVLLIVWLWLHLHTDRVQTWLLSVLANTDVSAKDFRAIAGQLCSSILCSGIFLSIGCAVAAASIKGMRLWLLNILLLVLLAAELVPANMRLSPSISDADMSFVPEVDEYIRQNFSQGLSRVISPPLLRPNPHVKIYAHNRSAAWLTLFYRMTGQSTEGIAKGIHYSLDRPVDQLNTMESNALFNSCMKLSEADRIKLVSKLNSSILMSLYDLKYDNLNYIRSFRTNSSIRLNLYVINGAIGRAYFTSGVEPAKSSAAALERLLDPGFSYQSTVILENYTGPAKPGQEGLGSASVLDYENRRVLCAVEAKTNGHLVLLDSYYPGWKAYLDGKPVEVFRANYAFRAVAVPAGKHYVEFQYQPLSFYLGCIVSCTTLLAAGCLVFGLRRSWFAIPVA